MIVAMDSIEHEGRTELFFAGDPVEIMGEMISIMEKFTLIMEELDKEKKGASKTLLKAAFETDPEVITNFTKLFVKATH